MLAHPVAIRPSVQATAPHDPSLQVAKGVMVGQRLAIPTEEQLAGRGGSFGGMQGYLALMHSCWAQEPGDRPAFGQVISKLRSLLAVAAAESVQPGASTPSGTGNGSGGSSGASGGGDTPEAAPGSVPVPGCAAGM